MRFQQVTISLANKDQSTSQIYEVPLYTSYIELVEDKKLSDLRVLIRDSNRGEMEYIPKEEVLRIIRFLLNGIEGIAIDGDAFDFEKARKLLPFVGIDIDKEYFQP